MNTEGNGGVLYCKLSLRALINCCTNNFFVTQNTAALKNWQGKNLHEEKHQRKLPRNLVFFCQMQKFSWEKILAHSCSMNNNKDPLNFVRVIWYSSIIRCKIILYYAQDTPNITFFNFQGIKTRIKCVKLILLFCVVVVSTYGIHCVNVVTYTHINLFVSEKWHSECFHF